MELDRVVWLTAAARVQRLDRLGDALWWASLLMLPVLAWVMPDLLLPALLLATVSLFFVRRVVFRVGAGRTVDAMRARRNVIRLGLSSSCWSIADN